jgi:glyoxylase-like metal-dependent hydrolase (beta-lactamase superfamily II)
VKKPLIALVIIVVGTAIGVSAQTPAPATPFTLKPLGHNVYAAITTAGAGAGGNASVVIGDDGVLVVDTFQRAEPARALLDEIHKLTRLPIKYVINTHYHYDHVSGNGVFAEAGALVMAHQNVRSWINTENTKFYGANITAEQKAAVAGLTPPAVVYSDGVDIFLGKRQVFARYFPGHTGGDTVVYDPESNTVFCGDMFWRHTLPNLIDATTSAWIQTLDLMIQHHPAAQFVSGHGDVGTLDDVKAFRGYLVDLRQWISEARTAGKTGDAIVDTVLPKLKDKYGDWASFNNFSRNNIIQTAAEFNGDKKIPRPPQQ